MFVFLLVVAALLVDRFVLLPEFEAGGGTTGGAWAAWLSVNLLPAVVWLMLEARSGERPRGQLVTGALAIVAGTAIMILPVLIWYTASGDNVAG